MRIIILSLITLLLTACAGDSSGSVDALRPGAARLGAEIAPTAQNADAKIAPTASADAKIAPTTPGVAEIAPTPTSEIAPTSIAILQKLHQQDMASTPVETAIYGGEPDVAWVIVLVVGFLLFLVWAILIGRAIARSTWRDNR